MAANERKYLPLRHLTRKSSEHGLEQDLTRWMPSGRPPRPMSRARPMRDGDWSRLATTTGASPAGRWNALPCDPCSPTSDPQGRCRGGLQGRPPDPLAC